MKKCTRCQIEKDKSFFSKRIKSYDGLLHMCKTCSSEYQSSRRIKSVGKEWNLDSITKVCLKCGVEHLKDNFRKKSDSPDGLVPWCTPCFKEYEHSRKETYKNTRDIYRSENREKELAQKKIYRELNRDELRIKNKAYDDSHRVEISLYRKNNRDIINSIEAKRRAAKLTAMPSWANLEIIKIIYKQCKEISELTGTVHHVDHVIPLISDIVCGLHCEANLTVLTAEANLSKGNRIWPDMP